MRIFLVLSLFISSLAFANPAYESRFRSAGASIPSALLQRGYSRFGGLDLRSFIADMAQVKLKVQGEDQIGRRNGDGRKTARWEITPEGRTITFDPEWITKPGLQSVVPMLALHEYLGILGFNDRRYNASLGLWFLTQSAVHQVLTAEEKAQIVNIIVQQLGRRTAGGVIGVGGGGQIFTQLYRGMMMLKTLKYFQLAQTAQDRATVMKALLELWLTSDEVTYQRGPNPTVNFSIQQ